MSDLDRIVAGISCREVLADLSDFLDGALPDGRVAQLRAHLAECAQCAQFGAEVTATLQALRDGQPPISALPGDTASRLRARLAAEYARAAEP